MNKQKQKAFTLLELLVVIAIIGILISLGVASFSNAQKKSRDSRRREDLKAVQNGLEQYYADFTRYSASSGSNENYLTNLMGGLLNLSNVSVSNEYFPAGAPMDPRGQNPYIYKATYNNNSYCVCALLENPGTGNSNSSTCGFVASGNYFCVSNLQ
jgi:prepilin-type N-terminal cleavage/methylation domain-containing protein